MDQRGSQTVVHAQQRLLGMASKRTFPGPSSDLLNRKWGTSNLHPPRPPGDSKHALV